MRAARYYEATDDVSKVRLETVPKPTPSKDLVVVKVIAAAANPVDMMVMKGWMVGAGWSLPLPMTIGYDFSGVVEAVADEDAAAGFKPGDEVFAVNWGSGKHDDGAVDSPPVAGAFAEFILIPASKLSKKPTALSFEQAAAAALVGTTAYQILHECAQITNSSGAATATGAGQRVLVLGGSSAVGAIAVQLAKASGAFVGTTCSTRNLDYVHSLGADVVVDYKQQPQWESEQSLQCCDAVLDTVGEPEALQRALSSGVLKADGRFVTIANTAVGFDPKAHPPLQYAAFHCLYNSPAQQDLLAEMLVQGKLTIKIDQQQDFTEEGVQALLKYVASGVSQGKNVLRVSPLP